MTIDTRELGHAHAALEMAGVPLLQPEAISEEAYGRKGFLPAELFMPTMHRLEPDVSDASVVTSLTAPWLGGPAVGALEELLGEHGERMVTHILGEYGLLAKVMHGANVLCTAVHMRISEAAPRHETIVAVWDDGYPYQEGDLQDRFAGHLLTGQPQELIIDDTGESKTVLLPGVIVDTAISTLGGSISFCSGERQLGIWPDSDGQLNISYGTAGRILGNLMVARLPHLNQPEPADC